MFFLQEPHFVHKKTLHKKAFEPERFGHKGILQFFPANLMNHARTGIILLQSPAASRNY